MIQQARREVEHSCWYTVPLYTHIYFSLASQLPISLVCIFPLFLLSSKEQYLLANVMWIQCWPFPVYPNII